VAEVLPELSEIRHGDDKKVSRQKPSDVCVGGG